MQSLPGAVVLAAGSSRRMGQPKMILPWGSKTVIEQVVSTLRDAGVSEIIVVTGGAREAVERALAGYPVRFVYNADFERSEMTTSLQVGLRELFESAPSVPAALVVLGDQPGIEAGVVQKVIAQYQAEVSALVVPSYQMHRGHPWLVDRILWHALFELTPDQTLREFLQAHAAIIKYVNVDTPGILKDLDTPEDYQAQKPAVG